MNPGFIDHKQPKLTKEKLSFQDSKANSIKHANKPAKT